MPDEPRARTRRITGSYSVGRVKTKELAKRSTRIVITLEDVDDVASFFQELASIMRGNKTKKIAIVIEEVE